MIIANLGRDINFVNTNEVNVKKRTVTMYFNCLL